METIAVLLMLLLMSPYLSRADDDDGDEGLSTCQLDKYYEGTWDVIKNSKLTGDKIVIGDNEMEVIINDQSMHFECADGSGNGYRNVLLSENRTSYHCLLFQFREDSPQIDYSILTDGGTFEGSSPVPEKLTYSNACAAVSNYSIAMDIQREYTDTEYIQTYFG